MVCAIVSLASIISPAPPQPYS